MHSYLIFNEIQSTKRLLNDYKLQNKSCNLKFLLLVSSAMMTSHGPPTSNKRRFKSIFFEAFPAWICFKFTQLISNIPLCILFKYEANDLNLLLFDVGGPSSLVMAGIQAILKFGPFSQYLPNSYIKSEDRTEFSSLFYIYSKISSFQTGLLHGLHL